MPDDRGRLAPHAKNDVTGASLVAEVEAQFDKFHFLFKQLCHQLASSNEEITTDTKSKWRQDKEFLAGTSCAGALQNFAAPKSREFGISGTERLQEVYADSPMEMLEQDWDLADVAPSQHTFEQQPFQPQVSPKDELPCLPATSLKGGKERHVTVNSGSSSKLSSMLTDGGEIVKAGSQRRSMHLAKLPSLEQRTVPSLDRSERGSTYSAVTEHSPHWNIKDSCGPDPPRSLQRALTREFLSGASSAVPEHSDPRSGFSKGKTQTIDLMITSGFEVDGAWRTAMANGEEASAGHTSSTTQQVHFTQQTYSDASLTSAASAHSKRPCFSKLPEKCWLTPNSPLRLTWDMLGILALMHDLVWIPLLMCNAPMSDLSEVLAWFLRIYWTSDVPLTFMTGFVNQDGEVVMESDRVAKRYCRSWMSFDIFLVVIDWIEMVLYEALGLLRSARFGKLLRTLRVIRMIRLARLAKLPVILNRLLERIFAEGTVMVLNISKITFVFLGFCHIIACSWFKLASYDEAKNWLKHEGLDEDITEFTYFVSLHWAVTQFIGNMEIYATNFSERVFSVIVLIVSFVASASFVSAITTSITRLQIISGQEQANFSMLRAFLRAQEVNTKLALRITKSAQYALRSQKSRVKEEEVELLSLVSGPLKVEMHYDMHGRVVQFHILFKLYCALKPAAMRRVCHDAVFSLSVVKDEVLFRKGTRPDPPSMFFLTKGSMSYAKDPNHAPDEKEDIEALSWASEPTLWLSNWVHRGRLSANVDSTVLQVHAETFQEVMIQEFDADDEDHPSWYAVWFAQRMSDLEPHLVSDLDPGFDLSDVHIRLADFDKGLRERRAMKSGMNMFHNASRSSNTGPWTLDNRLSLSMRLSAKGQVHSRRSAISAMSAL